MTCTEIPHQLEMFVDGELPSESKRLVQLHLESCETCQARVDELRAQAAMIVMSQRQERAPSDLWARIEAKLPEGASDPGIIRPAIWWRDKIRPLTLAASITLLLGIGAGAGWWQFSTDYSVVAAPVQDFTTYRLSGRALDVESADPSVIQAWFEERLAFELPEVKARVAGFDLVGGRLCWFLDRRVSALAYQRGDQVISVYVMADHDLPLPETTFEPQLSISRSVHKVDDVNNLIWRHDDLVFTVVSDLREADLSIFLAALAREGRNSAALSRDFLEHPPKVIGGST